MERRNLRKESWKARSSGWGDSPDILEDQVRRYGGLDAATVAVQAARIPDTVINAIIHSLILFTSPKLFYLS